MHSFDKALHGMRAKISINHILQEKLQDIQLTNAYIICCKIRAIKTNVIVIFKFQTLIFLSFYRTVLYEYHLTHQNKVLFLPCYTCMLQEFICNNGKYFFIDVEFYLLQLFTNCSRLVDYMFDLMINP